MDPELCELAKAETPLFFHSEPVTDAQLEVLSAVLCSVRVRDSENCGS